MVLIFLLVSWNGANKSVLLGPISLMAGELTRDKGADIGAVPQALGVSHLAHGHLVTDTSIQCDKPRITDTVTPSELIRPGGCDGQLLLSRVMRPELRNW